MKKSVNLISRKVDSFRHEIFILEGGFSPLPASHSPQSDKQEDVGDISCIFILKGTLLVFFLFHLRALVLVLVRLTPMYKPMPLPIVPSLFTLFHFLMYFFFQLFCVLHEEHERKTLVTMKYAHSSLQVWFSNRRAKWRREEKLRTQRRSVDHVSGGGGGGNGSTNNNNGSGNAGSNGSANVGNTNSVSPPVPTTPRIPLNSGFNSMYASIPQPIATMAENYR